MSNPHFVWVKVNGKAYPEKWECYPMAMHPSTLKTEEEIVLDKHPITKLEFERSSLDELATKFPPPQGYAWERKSK